ncbi:MAG: Asp23/Gls24 family envelope stress response protein [Chloroflexi bacterium]|nr:MAG: Asp23/Gls24 family envelope stress response protein [Chloroflexota bacterium]
MPIKEGKLGMIEISTTAVSTIAGQAINQCYGVVGMSSKNLVNSITTMLSADQRRGINVTIEDDQIDIDVYVIVEYGVNIRAVAESIQHTVKFHVEKSLGLPVESVNVFIQGLRIKKEKSKEKSKEKQQP